MKLNNPDLQNRLAGEYVLGTLRGPARQRFEHYMTNSQALREAVTFWENALAPLHSSVPAAPSRELLPAIEARLGWVEKPQSRGFFSWLPALGFAVVAGFSLLLWAPWSPSITPDFALAAATEEGAVRWQFAVDKSHDWIDVRVLSVPAVTSAQDLELWLLVADAAPISLGLLSEVEGQVQRIKASVHLSLGQGLAVSIEPAGGSPSGAPTGPVIAASMFPTA